MEMTRDLDAVKAALAANKKVRYGDGIDPGNKVVEIIDDLRVKTSRRGTRKDGVPEVVETVDIDPSNVFIIY